MIRRFIFLLLPLVVLAAPAFASSIGIAVKRGQKIIDPSTLPLACITVETNGAALPLDVLVLEDVTTHREYKAYVTKSFNPSHPDLLTATIGNSRSLSLAILKLVPGRYRVKALEFDGPTTWNGISSLLFDLTKGWNMAFTVKPACANYVGTLVISANWKNVKIPQISGYNGGFAESKFSTNFTAEATATRDMKWASDMVPGMRSVPSVASPIENSP